MSAVKVCEKCGATYLASVGYCKNCGENVQEDLSKNEVLLEDIKISEWKEYIGKESARYIKVFTKNQGKKVFLSMNWSAFFFGFYWMFYRKMYKFAFWYLAIATVISSLILSIAMIAYTGTFEDYLAKEAAYEKLYEQVKEAYPDAEHREQRHDIIDSHPITAEYRAAEKKADTFYIAVLVPAVFAEFFSRLFADWAYREHIKRNINNRNGGTSGSSAFVAVVLRNVITGIFTILEVVLIASIMGVVGFFT